MTEKTFPEGIFFNERRDNAPQFVLGSISIQPDKLIKFLNGQEERDDGSIRLDILRSKKTGKPYLVVNEFVPQLPKI
jgi:hypothetical protein